MPSVDGIASGLDTTSLIEAIVSVAEIPKQTLEAKVSDVEDQIDKVGEFKTKLTALQTALEDIDTANEFGKNSVSLSEDGWVEVEVDASTPTGGYQLDVVALARAEMEVSQGFADDEQAGLLGSGDLQITLGTTTETVTVGAADTLQDIADSIDDVDGLSAYVMNDGDASNPYRLVVMADETGASNTISIDTSALSGGMTPTFTEASTAQDAEITMNGITINSDTNTLDGIVPGMELSLSSVTTDTLTITVARDMDEIVAGVEAFVDAFNDLASFYSLNTDFDADEGIRGALFGDSTVRGIMDGLSNKLSDNWSTDDYFGLGNIGINTKQTGKLEFDSDVFEEQLAENPQEVLDLFTADDSFAYSTIELIDETYLSDDGLIETRTETLEETVEELEESIERIEDRLESMESRLKKQFTYMETVLGQLQSTQGFLGQLLSSSSSSSSSS